MLDLGFATRPIAPPRPALIMGQMHRRIGQQALDPIEVTAWAMARTGDGTDGVVLVSCDLALPSDGLYRTVRRGLAEARLPVPGDAVILAATHTHTSLVLEDGYYLHPGGDVMTPAECEALVAERIVEAVLEAWAARRPRVVGRAFAHAVVGHNRYAVYADGTGRMYGKTRRDDFEHIGGTEDHSLDLVFAWEPDGALAGVAAVIPCPSQVTEQLESFSADYWHEVRVELRLRLGAHLSVLGLCGAAGDQSPHFLLYAEQEGEMRRRRGASERQELGVRVADAVEGALTCTAPEAADPCPLAHAVRRLDLPPRSISKSERDEAEALWGQAAARGDTQTWWPLRLRAVVDTFDGRRPAAPVPAELHAVRLGDLVLVTNPFELFLDYGLRIKARSPAPQTAVVQLAGSGFYLPTARAVATGGYGAMPAVAAAGPEAGALLVEATLAMIGEVLGPGPGGA